MLEQMTAAEPLPDYIAMLVLQPGVAELGFLPAHPLSERREGLMLRSSTNEAQRVQSVEGQCLAGVSR